MRMGYFGYFSAFGGDVKVGDKGADVTELQRLLSLVGMWRDDLHPEEAGVYGPWTLVQVIKFQKGAGVTPADGFVGDATWAALRKDEQKAPASYQPEQLELPPGYEQPAAPQASSQSSSQPAPQMTSLRRPAPTAVTTSQILAERVGASAPKGVPKIVLYGGGVLAAFVLWKILED